MAPEAFKIELGSVKEILLQGLSRSTLNQKAEFTTKSLIKGNEWNFEDDSLFYRKPENNVRSNMIMLQ